MKIFTKSALLSFFIITMAFAEPDMGIVAIANDPSTLVDGVVNVITGSYVSSEEDIVIQGEEPIPIRRSYFSTDSSTGGEWRIGVIATLDGKVTGDDSFFENIWTFVEPNGCAIEYEKEKTIEIDGQNYFRCIPINLGDGYSNTSQGEISSRTNLQNNYVLLEGKKHFRHVIVYAADGTVRTYKRSKDPTLHHASAYRLISEKLPNGRYRIYHYRENHGVAYLRSIVTTDSERKVKFAKALFSYVDTYHHYVRVQGSDGQKLEYVFERDATNRMQGRLVAVRSSKNGNCHLTYSGNAPKHLRKIYQNGRLVYEIKYYPLDSPHCGKVHQLLVVNPESEKLTVSRTFEYAKNCASVFDVGQNETKYYWDSQYRLEKIERFSKNGLFVNQEKFFWAIKKHYRLLIKKIYFDEEKNPVSAKCLSYDAFGNIIKESLFGNLSGSSPPLVIESDGSIQNNGVESQNNYFVYSPDPMHLLLEKSSDCGPCIQYRYLPETDLITHELICDHELICLRKFWIYDSHHTLIRIIEDNGSGWEAGDLSNVTERTICNITPNSSSHFTGLPQVIEKKFIQENVEKSLNTTMFSYNANGLVAMQTVCDADHRISYSLKTDYDERNRIVREENALGEPKVFTYDKHNNLVSTIENLGQTTVRYDKLSRPVHMRFNGYDGLLADIDYQYDQKNRLVSETDFRGHRTEYRYDLMDHRIETILPVTVDATSQLASSSQKELCDSLGRVVKGVDCEGNITKYSYNILGSPTEIIHPNDRVEQFRYYPDGTLKTYVDPNGVVTENEVDFLRRTIRQIKSLGDAELSVEKWEYRGHSLMAHIDCENHRTEFRYDGAGRKIYEESEGEWIIYGYDALGRLNRKEQCDSITTTTFDFLDRIIEQSEKSLSGDDIHDQRWVFNNVGDCIETISSDSHERFRFDSRHRLIEKTNGIGAKERIVYDDYFENDFHQKVLRKTHIDPIGHETIETFDPLNRLIRIEKFSGHLISSDERRYNRNDQVTFQLFTSYEPSVSTQENRWEYDANDHWVKWMVGVGSESQRVTKRRYSKTGLLTEVIKPDGVVLSYGYSPLGYLNEIASSDSTVHHELKTDRLGRVIASEYWKRTVDGHGRVTKEEFSSGSCVESQYDAMGRRTLCHLHPDCQIRYNYHGFDFASIARENQNGDVLYTHEFNKRDPIGNCFEQTLITNHTLLSSFDPANRKTEIALTRNDEKIFSQQLSYDLSGRLFASQFLNGRVEYEYDGLDQLTRESGLITHEYRYDNRYNRIEKDRDAILVGDLDELQSIEYDPNGNPTRIDDRLLSYDALDRLIRVVTPSAEENFYYDAFDRIIYQTIGNEERYFLYDGANEVGSFDKDGRFFDLRILGEPFLGEIGPAIAIEIDGAVYAPVHDFSLNVVMLLPLHGQDILENSYNAFGEERASISPWRFASKRVDPISELIYFGKRFYDPQLARFLTPDPIGDVDGINHYAYLHNNPLTHIDLDGLMDLNSQPNFTFVKRNYSQDPYFLAKVGIPPSDKPLITSGPPIDFHLESSYSPHFYINGMNTSQRECLMAANTLAETLGESNVIPFYSPSDGFFFDLYSVHESIYNSDFSNPTIRSFHDTLHRCCTEMDAIQDPRKIFITCFSRGAPETYHAVKNLTQQERDRLVITACGPVMILPRDLGFSVTNIISSGDRCSFYCNKGLRENPDMYGDRANVRIIQQIDGFHRVIGDHSFSSKTYQEGLKRFAVPIYENYGFKK